MAGRRNRYGYQEYRGRSAGRTVLIFIIALLAVLLAAGAAFMAVMGEYIRYTDTGVEIDWPWLSGGPSAPPEISDPVVVVTDDVVVSLEPSAEPTPTPGPAVSYEAVGAVTVSEAQVRGGTAAQAVDAAGGNALVVEMKTASGELKWQSQTPMAASMGVNAGDNLTAQAIQTLSQTTGLHLAARVHCFKDPVLGRARIGTIMTQGGNIWYDRVGVCWTSPASQQTVDYLSALCAELADMGFDEIVLDSAGFPDDGQVNVLAVSENRPGDLTAPVAAFYERLSGELAEKGVILSVQTTEQALRGDNTLSGITAQTLAQYAGRVWLPASTQGTDYAGILTAAGLDNPGARLVVENSPSGSWYR